MTVYIYTFVYTVCVKSCAHSLRSSQTHTNTHCTNARADQCVHPDVCDGCTYPFQDVHEQSTDTEKRIYTRFRQDLCTQWPRCALSVTGRGAGVQAAPGLCVSGWAGTGPCSTLVTHLVSDEPCQDVHARARLRDHLGSIDDIARVLQWASPPSQKHTHHKPQPCKPAAQQLH